MTPKTTVKLNASDKLKVIYTGIVSRLEACRGEKVSELTVENILEIGLDVIDDDCPFGGTVFLGPDGQFYELAYKVRLKRISRRSAKENSGQQCIPHDAWDCAECTERKA